MWWGSSVILREITNDSRTGYNLPSRNTKRPEYTLIKRSLLCKIQTDSARDHGKNEDEFN